MHESIDGCWHEIQNLINEAIIVRRSDNSNLQLPPLLPPPSGVEMFGFTSPSIIEAIEALDPFHQCIDYWSLKLGQRPSSAGADARRAGISVVGRLSALEQPLKPSMLETAQECRIVNRNSRHSVNISSAKTTPASSPAFVQVSPLPLRQGPVPSQGTYSTLQGLFLRATSAELRLLYRLFTNESQGAEWSSALRALTEEVQRRFL